MANRLQAKVGLVSGSTRGIGRSIAQQFASEGAKVAVTGRTVAKGEKVVDLIKSAGGGAEFFPLDIPSEESGSGVVDAVLERFGARTTLINNAPPTGTLAPPFKTHPERYTPHWHSMLLRPLTGN